MTPMKQFQGYVPPAKLEDMQADLMDPANDMNVPKIIEAMNSHLKKKEAVRIAKLSSLQDIVYEQMSKRLVEKGDCFSNKDLIEYCKVIDDIISKTNLEEDAIKAGNVQINQEVNINLTRPTMTANERQQVADAVKSIIAKVQKDTQVLPENDVIQGEYTSVN